MINEVLVIGDLKLREGAAGDEYDRLGERMYGIVSKLPGFQSVKSFKPMTARKSRYSASRPSRR
jgi:heme-degrading monooxygenase HmoA